MVLGDPNLEKDYVLGILGCNYPMSPETDTGDAWDRLTSRIIQ